VSLSRALSFSLPAPSRPPPPPHTHTLTHSLPLSCFQHVTLSWESTLSVCIYYAIVHLHLNNTRAHTHTDTQ
jgi:hypothetical protein